MVLRAASPATLDRRFSHLLQRLRAARLSADHRRSHLPRQPCSWGIATIKATFFTEDGAPKYFHDRTFPIDIHACSQAILHFIAFSSIDPQALELARKTFRWTMRNMAAPEGAFYYQRHRLLDQPRALHAVGASLDAARTCQITAGERFAGSSPHRHG